MPRLIDAEALLDKLKIRDLPIRLTWEIQNAPTIDAVPVVRCRECQHWSIPDDSYGWCSEWENTVENPECYCSWGQRRKDGDA